MSRKNLRKFQNAMVDFHLNDQPNEQLRLHTYPALARWLRSGWDVGTTPSTLVDRSIKSGSARRLAQSFGLQSVLLDAVGTPHELPDQLPAPNIVGPTFRCEISGVAAAMLHWSLHENNDPTATALEVTHDGARIINGLARLGEGAAIATTVRKEFIASSIITVALLSQIKPDMSQVIGYVQSMPQLEEI